MIGGIQGINTTTSWTEVAGTVISWDCDLGVGVIGLMDTEVDRQRTDQYARVIFLYAEFSYEQQFLNSYGLK